MSLATNVGGEPNSFSYQANAAGKSSTGTPAYEKTSGEIRLVYEEVTLEGGTETSGDEFRRLVQALSYERSLDLDTHDLMLWNELLEPGVAYRLDIAKNSLVRVERTEKTTHDG